MNFKNSRYIIFTFILIILTSFSYATVQSDLNSGAIYYYELEETTTDYIDSVGNDDLTLGDLPDRVTGKINFGQQFDSLADEYITMGADATHRVNYPVISFWYKPASVDIQYLMSGFETEGNNEGWLINTNADGTILFQTYDNNLKRDRWLTTSSVVQDTWIHIFAYWDGTDSYMCLNGVSDGSQTLDEHDTLSYGDSHFVVGSRYVDGAYENVYTTNGIIDEVYLGNFGNTASCSHADYLYSLNNPTNIQQYVFGIDNTSFSIIPIIPLNNSRNSTNLTIKYEVTDTTNTTIDCTLFVDYVNVSTQNNIVVNTTLTWEYPLTVDDNYTWSLYCSNGTINDYTGNYTYIFDSTKPFILINTPNSDNSTTFTYNNRSLTLNITILDQNLYKGNLTIYNSSGSVMYNNYTGDITGNTSFTWNDIININTWTTGLYTGFIEASDSHTAKSIKDGFNPIKKKDTKIKYKTPKEWGNTEFSFEYIGKNKIKSYEDIKKFDRHSININFDKVNGFRWEEFYINADKPLKYIKNSNYPCHIVSETGMVGLWFDCVYNGMDNDIQIVEKINDYEYKINIYTDNEIIEFNSLGGLNNNNASFNFNILENLTIIANDTNTGLLISNFSVIYDSNIYTASGTNLTISVLANTTNNILVYAIGYGSYNNNTFVGFSPKTLTVNLTSGGTVLKFYDEKTNSLITSTNVTVDMVGNISGRFSTSLGSITISGLPTGNYSAVYFADGYAPREYPIELNATGLEIINLYLCNSSICEDIIVNVFDTVGSGLPDYEVQVLKLIDGNYILVEKAISNFEGQTGISAITFEPSYKFLVVKDNIVQKTTGETEIYSDTLNFFISEFESIIQRYIKLGNFQYILRYDEPLNQFQLSYLDPTSNLSEVCLRVTSKTNYTEEILYNETCLNSFSGVINVNVVEQIGTTYTAKIFTSFSPEQYVDTLVKKFDDVLNSGKVGLWMTLLLILIVAFVGIWFPSISILFIAIILWITRVLGLHEFGYTTITGITVGCVIFSYIFAKVN